MSDLIFAFGYSLLNIVLVTVSAVRAAKGKSCWPTFIAALVFAVILTVSPMLNVESIADKQFMAIGYIWGVMLVGFIAVMTTAKKAKNQNLPY